MSEPSYEDGGAVNRALIQSLALALIAAGVLTPSEIGAACRRTAEDLPDLGDDGVRDRLLAFAKTMERAEAGADRLLAPRWTPEVVPGGHNGGGTNG